MIGSLWKGVSGVYQHDRGISVEANNSANVSVIGHKKDEIIFADMFYKDGGMGHGAITHSISKSFTQGHIVQTGVGIDVALEGKGFLIVRSRSNPDQIFYTRAGDLNQAKDGFLINQADYKMQGLVPQSRLRSSTDPLDTMFTQEFQRNIISTTIRDTLGRAYNINIKTTDYLTSAKDDDVLQKGDNYKSAQSKINDVGTLIKEYMDRLDEYKSNPNDPDVASQNQKSQVDFYSQLSSIIATQNSLSISIGDRTFTVEFDRNSNITQNDMDEIYSFLDANGKAKFGLVDPSTIPTQADIDAMPTSTPEEVAAKTTAQLKRDTAVANYTDAKALVGAMQDLSDKISATAGFTASVKGGVLEIESLVRGKEFKLSEIKFNSQSLNSTNTQEAIKGSGMAMLDSAKEALKSAVEKAGAKYLEITNILDYADLGSIGLSDINLRLDILGLQDTSEADVEISDDGFIFVTSKDSKFLVGRLSTAAFRNEQGLEAIGGNLYSKTDLSGEPFNADSMNRIKGKALEKSNVDYGTTLTQLMIYQRAFEASSKSITTSDEFLQTAINLIK